MTDTSQTPDLYSRILSVRRPWTFLLVTDVQFLVYWSPSADKSQNGLSSLMRCSTMMGQTMNSRSSISPDSPSWRSYWYSGITSPSCVVRRFISIARTCAYTHNSTGDVKRSQKIKDVKLWQTKTPKAFSTSVRNNKLHCEYLSLAIYCSQIIGLTVPKTISDSVLFLMSLCLQSRFAFYSCYSWAIQCRNRQKFSWCSFLFLDYCSLCFMCDYCVLYFLFSM